jgi:hypothetical protein
MYARCTYIIMNVIQYLLLQSPGPGTWAMPPRPFAPNAASTAFPPGAPPNIQQPPRKPWDAPAGSGTPGPPMANWMGGAPAPPIGSWQGVPPPVNGPPQAWPGMPPPQPVCDYLQHC